MKKYLLIASLLGCFVESPSHAQQNGFGLGIILGEPTGISGKTWVSERNAFAATVAYSFRRKGYFHLHADYLWHFPEAIKSSDRLALYGGIGGRLSSGRGAGILGMRIVGGLAWYPRGSPLEIFAEFAPIFDFAPATELSANGGLGIRFYF
jgi:hypothetical protein